ncbi:unnamed protein product, partial [Didymodactylos carnosus]
EKGFCGAIVGLAQKRVDDEVKGWTQ